MYNGRVFGETKSSVRAHIDSGVFTGSIVLPDETYHIEVSIFFAIVVLSHLDTVIICCGSNSHHGDIYLIYPINT